MKRIPTAFAVLMLLLVAACSKKEDETTATTPTNNPGTGPSLIVDGNAVANIRSGKDTAQGYLSVYCSDSAGIWCQVLFTSKSPASGDYPANWTTAPSSSQSKPIISMAGKQYIAADGAKVSLTNSGSGKFTVVFSNIVFDEFVNGTRGTAKKTVSGNFGN